MGSQRVGHDWRDIAQCSAVCWTLSDLCEVIPHCSFDLRGSEGKESACYAGDAGHVGSIPGSGRSSGGGHGNPLQYSCLGNPMDRRKMLGYVTVHWVTKSRISLKRPSANLAHKNAQCWASFHVKHHSVLWKRLISWHGWSLGAMCMKICWRSILRLHCCCSFDYGNWLLSSYLSSHLGAQTPVGKVFKDGLRFAFGKKSIWLYCGG